MDGMFFIFVMYDVFFKHSSTMLMVTFYICADALSRNVQLVSALRAFERTS